MSLIDKTNEMFLLDLQSKEPQMRIDEAVNNEMAALVEREVAEAEHNMAWEAYKKAGEAACKATVQREAAIRAHEDAKAVVRELRYGK